MSLKSLDFFLSHCRVKKNVLKVSGFVPIHQRKGEKMEDRKKPYDPATDKDYHKRPENIARIVRFHREGLPVGKNAMLHELSEKVRGGESNLVI